ncbi:uncharacterized protein G6M90_00g054610 [Metarhizium brunneum]|uniref:Uncharacterized protein n=1 Tax=Metarhizium brunneum TaxID=500148 RepID=A0A7D5UXN7_9HYPO
MDPFSIAVETAGLADVSFRLLLYLADINKASTEIQDAIAILSEEIKSFLAVNDSVEDFPHPRRDLGNFEAPLDHESDVDKVKRTIEQLETLLREIVGNKGKLWQSVAQKTEQLPADELSKAGEHLPGDDTWQEAVIGVASLSKAKNREHSAQGWLEELLGSKGYQHLSLTKVNMHSLLAARTGQGNFDWYHQKFKHKGNPR